MDHKEDEERPPDLAVHLSPFAVLLSAALVLICAAASVKFSLGLHRTLAVASIRWAHMTLHYVSHSHFNERQDIPLSTQTFFQEERALRDDPQAIL